MDNEFKIGDRVVCVDDESSFGRLREGNTYTVTAAYDGTPTVEVRNSYHTLERFRKVERTDVHSDSEPS